jgi:hypothetical protein
VVLGTPIALHSNRFFSLLTPHLLHALAAFGWLLLSNFFLSFGFLNPFSSFVLLKKNFSLFGALFECI